MLNFHPDQYPILNIIQHNELTQAVFEMLDQSGYDQEGIIDIEDSLKFFPNQILDIHLISSDVNKALSQTSKLLKDKPLLASTPESTGLLLFTESIIPDFSNVPAYVEARGEDTPYNAVLYSWLESNHHDQVAGNYDPEDPFEKEGRTLIIIPIDDKRITQATKQFHLISND